MSRIGGRFVCTGNGGTGYVPMFVSSNGSTWTKLATSNYFGFRSVAGANGIYAGVGGAGYIASSRNLIDWTTRLWTTNVYKAVAFGAGKFVALSSTAAAISGDGVSWTEHSITNFGWFNPFSITIIFNGTEFVATGGRTLVSANGSEWASRPGGSGQSIALRNGLYVAVGDGGSIQTSMTLTNWSLQPFVTTNTLWSVCSSEAGFAAVGNYGTFLTSVDGTNWQTVPTKTLLHFLSVAVDGPNFVASGEGGAIVHYGPQAIPEARLISAVYTNGNALVNCFGINGFGFRIEQSKNLLEWAHSRWIPGSAPIVVSNVSPQRMFFRTVFQ